MSLIYEPSLREQRLLEQLCDEFESAWQDFVVESPKNAVAPELDTVMSRVTGPLRTIVFRELLAIEFVYRNQRTENDATFDVEYYESRYIEMQDIVRELAGVYLTAPVLTNESNGDRIGRYTIERELGRGAFATVYQAFDPTLQRQVAIKVPRGEMPRGAHDMSAYLSEARILASLHHPHIVPVYDVAEMHAGVHYVVAQLIEGETLADRIRRGAMPWRQAALMLANIADALHYAHARGLVHRDVKPANILIDHHEHPFLTDFGLALQDADFGNEALQGGTIAYMSPEQARGEGHLVDGRSDIFSLGATLYEALTGARPFRGESWRQVVEQIVDHDARPLRMVNDTVPKELERICLKALSRRASERYNTASDMANELRDVASSPEVTPVPTDLQDNKASQCRSVVPKGLAPYFEEDADFFLRMLPGPRGRGDIPQSIHFWKSRIEQRDPDKTFRIGLIYGPSGCGKTSFLRAGLLPSLDEQVKVAAVDCSGGDVEARMLKAMQKAFPEVANITDAVEAASAVRRSVAPRSHSKLVIVLDQFEHWLYGRYADDSTGVVAALRQCDGEHLQCILMVRDDFWLAVTRLFDELDVDLIEDHNTALLDLFDQRHARNVLVELGQAYECLPDDVRLISPLQHQFLDEAIADLSHENKVICVRLAVFVEMVKEKPWVPATLRRIDGQDGVVTMYLDDSFSSSASPARRRHRDAARRILKSMLPEMGQDIKGLPKSEGEMQTLSGYEGRPREYAELIRILDQETRLIAPVDLQAQTTDDAVAPREKHYQLTHDYLIGPLRRWLVREQMRTRKGRTRTLLIERAGQWKTLNDDRLLPSAIELAKFITFTRPREWTPTEGAMIWKAVKRICTGILAVGVLGFLGNYQANQYFVGTKISTLTSTVEDLQVPVIIGELEEDRSVATAILKQRIRRMPVDDVGLWRMKIALAHLQKRFPDLPDRWQDIKIPPPELALLFALFESSDYESVISTSRCWENFRPALENTLAYQDEAYNHTDILYNASLLALTNVLPQEWRARDSFIDDLSPAEIVANALIRQTQFSDTAWCPLLHPCRDVLKEPLEDYFYGKRGWPGGKDQIRAARLLAEFFSDSDSSYLVKLLATAEPQQFREIFPRLSGRHAGEQQKIQQALMAYIQQSNSHLSDAGNSPISRVNAAIAWMQFHSTDIPILQHAIGAANPTSVRRLFIHRAHDCLADEFDGSFDRFWTGTDVDPVVQTALMLAIAQHDQHSMLDESQRKIASHLGNLYAGETGPQIQQSASVHAAAWYFLQRWFGEIELDPTGILPDVDVTDRPIYTDRSAPRRQMAVAVQDVTEATLPPRVAAGWDWFRVAFTTEDGSQVIRHSMSVIRSTDNANERFAISMTEVTRAQYLGMFPEYCRDCGGLWDSYRSDSRAPMTFVSLFDAAAYCNRLSACAGLDQNQWCYEFWKNGTNITTDVTAQVLQATDGRTGAPSWHDVTLRLAEDWTHRIGYRLPTMSEWDAARGDSFQDATSSRLLNDYAWFDISAANTPLNSRAPSGVGMKMPNQFGLFDMLGNVSELCHIDASAFAPSGTKVLLSGGSVASSSDEIESPRMDFDGTTRNRLVGFRIVRTLPSE